MIAVRIAASGEVRIGGPLIRIRAHLITPTASLVVIGPHLILITPLLLDVAHLLAMPAIQQIAILGAAITTFSSPIPSLRRSIAITLNSLLCSIGLIGPIPDHAVRLPS